MNKSAWILMVALLFAGSLALSHRAAAAACPHAGVSCADHLPKSGSGSPICVQPDPSEDPMTKYICVGSSVTLHVTTSDQDAYGEPIPCDDADPTLSWSDSAGGSAGNVTSYEFNRSSTPGTYTVTCTATDAVDVLGEPGYDRPETVTWTVCVVGITSISGPADVCRDTIVRYTIGVAPTGLDFMVHWCVDGNWRQTGGTTLDIQWGDYGQHTVSACCTNCSTGCQSLTVKVKPDPPTCDSQPLSCMAAGGGCGGSCGGDGGGMPDADLRSKSIVTPLPYPGGPGVGSYYPDFNDPNGQTCGSDTMKIVAACDGHLYVQYKSSCSGKCYVVDVTTGTSWEIGDGITISRDETTYRATYAGGRKYDFSLPEPGPSTGFVLGPKGPDLVTEPNGQTTTTTLDENGNLHYVDTPYGRWEYTVDSAGKLTLVAPPDDTRLQLEYIAQGNYGAGKLGSVKVWANQSDYSGQQSGDIKSETDYSYDGSGRLSQVTKGDRTVHYTYNQDGSNTITMSETDVTTHIKTVYDYNTSAVTKVKRKHPSNSQYDQMTQYTFSTNGAGHRMYVTDVQDPEGNITHYTLDTYGSVTHVYNVVGVNHEHEVVTTYATGTSGTVAYNVGPATIAYPGSYTEEYTYYQVSGNNTPFVKTHKDTRGKYTLYVRDESDSGANLWKVTGIKVSDTGTDWSTQPYTKTFTYYGSTSGIQANLVETETVPDIDGSTPQTTTYQWYETIGNEDKLRSSPAKVTTQWWDPTANSGNGDYVYRYEWNAYDDMGRLTKHTDASGDHDNTSSVVGKTWYTYDALGRSLSTIYTRDGTSPTESSAPLAYTENSYTCCRLQKTKDENGNWTHYSYDNANRVMQSWTDLQSTGDTTATPLVAYTYDAFGNKATVTTRAGSGTGEDRATAYEYDKDNRVTRITYQDSLIGEEQFGYDVYGNLWWKRQKKDSTNWQTTLYRYDDLNRLIDVYYNYTGSLSPPSYTGLTADVSYTYDGGSSLRLTMTDIQGESDYEYDTRGRMTSYTPPVPASHAAINYNYNNLGQKTGVKIGSGTSYDLKYNYFANGWLKSVQTGDGDGNYNDLAKFSYNSVGTRSQQDNYYSGNRKSYSTYAYDSDPRYRLNSISHYKDGNSTALETIDYTRSGRDKVGNPLSADDWRGNTSYTYDDNNRLDGATYPGSVSEDYGYDWLGNRKNPPASSNDMVFNKVDELTSRPGNNERTWTYDNLGNLYQIADPSASVLKEFSYFGSGLVNRAQFDHRSQYIDNYWDGDSNRVQLDSWDGDNTNTYKFVYDVTAGIPAVVKEITPSATIYYYREPGGELLARQEGTTGSTRRYYHFDGLGSTSLLTNTSGDWTDKYSYDGWGNVLQHSTATGSIDQPYQYVGQLGYYTHYMVPGSADFRLLQAGVRFYDPQVGRFTQTDPIRDGMNHYAYVGDRPTTATDPSGLAPQFKGCSDKQRKELQQHLNDIGKNRIKCITGGKNLQTCIRNRLQNVVIICETASNCSPGDSGWTDPPTPRNTIHVCPDAIAGKLGCLGKTLLHEMAHSCTPHATAPPTDPPEGWQCESDCYGKDDAPCPK